MLGGTGVAHPGEIGGVEVLLPEIDAVVAEAAGDLDAALGHVLGPAKAHHRQGNLHAAVQGVRGRAEFRRYARLAVELLSGRRLNEGNGVEYRRLGKTGLEVSVVGMGCWGLSGGLGPVSQAQANATVHAAIDAGVTLFDTADAYGPRLSELMLGKALRGVRDQVLIATKVGQIGWNTGNLLSYESVEHVHTCCDASLYRLGTDVIDIYQCHQPNPAHPEVLVEAFEQLLQAGKIRAYGVSTDDPVVLRAFDERGGNGVCQLGYSALNRAAEREVLPLCADRDIGTLVRVPLERGILTGKFDRDTVFDDMNRSAWNEGARAEFLAQLDAAGQMRPLTNARRNLTQVSLAYLLAHRRR